MSVMSLYVIYDCVAEESGPVYEAKNDAIALRNYGNFLKKMEHKEDFRLFKVGEIDHDSNIITAMRLPIEMLDPIKEED